MTVNYFLLLVVFFNTTLSALDIEFREGYQAGSLNWNIASPTHEPNVLSELKWSDLKAAVSQLEIKYAWTDHFFARAEGSYGQIFDGKNKDTDYSASDRKNAFMTSWADAKKGEVFDISLGIGYTLKFDFFNEYLNISPMFGYNLSEQHLRMYSPADFIYQGPNDIFNPNDMVIIGKIENLHSHYRAKWEGFWYGLDANYDYNNYHFIGGIEYRLYEYDGHGHWNLREDFANGFDHSGSAEGYKVKLGASCEVHKNLGISLRATYENSRLVNGRSYYEFADGGETFKAFTRLNRVEWQSAAVLIGLNYTF